MKRQVMILSLIKDNNHGLKNNINLASSLESQYSSFKYPLMPRNAICVDKKKLTVLTFSYNL